MIGAMNVLAVAEIAKLERAQREYDESEDPGLVDAGDSASDGWEGYSDGIELID